MTSPNDVNLSIDAVASNLSPNESNASQSPLDTTLRIHEALPSPVADASSSGMSTAATPLHSSANASHTNLANTSPRATLLETHIETSSPTLGHSDTMGSQSRLSAMMQPSDLSANPHAHAHAASRGSDIAPHSHGTHRKQTPSTSSIAADLQKQSNDRTNNAMPHNSSFSDFSAALRRQDTDGSGAESTILAWKDLTVSVGSGKTKKILLNNIAGQIRNGLIACMGPSGRFVD